MARKVIGPTGSQRRRWLLLCTTIAAIAMAVVFIPSAFAVHDTGAFELDGNATNNAAVAGDDWDNVCHQVTITQDTSSSIADQCASASDTTGAAGVSWIAEPNLNSSIFTGGGSKDPQNVSSWAWKDGAGGLPDKDNLLHAMAAEYSLPGTINTGICPNGTDILPDGTIDPNAFDNTVNCRVLYFGSDRYDNSGDAQQGFWFFQNKIGLGTNAVGGGTGFTGVHKNGDVLVISDFSNGGTTSTITVYKWDSACTKGANNPQPGQCGDVNLRLLSTSTNALCTGLAQNDNACGLVNSSLIAMPWSFTDKSGTPNNGALNGEFFEAGINLSTLGLAGECFSSVASETRSSTSTTATLKDFVLGGFEKCTPNLTTQVKNSSGTDTNGTIQPGTPVHDTATVTVTGAQTPDDATGTVNFSLCGPVASIPASGNVCDVSGVTIVGAGTNKTLQNQSGGTTTDGISVATSDDVNGAGSGLANGYYCFKATATLTNYDSPDPATNNTTECFRVLKLTPTVLTTPVDGSGTSKTTIALGASIYDNALVTGSADGGDPTGQVNFFLCKIETGTCDKSDTAHTGTAVTGNPQTCTPDGTTPPNDTTYTCTATSGQVTPSSTGRYCFRGEYGGNTIYDPNSDSGSNECFTVTNSASGSSSQKWLPNDHVVVTANSGSLPGKLEIKLYKGTLGTDCSTSTGTLKYTEPVPNSGAFTATAAGATYDTTNSTFTVNITPDNNAGDYFWRIVFTPGTFSGTTFTPDPYGTGFTKCETSSVSINDSP